MLILIRCYIPCWSFAWLGYFGNITVSDELFTRYTGQSIVRKGEGDSDGREQCSGFYFQTVLKSHGLSRIGYAWRILLNTVKHGIRVKFWWRIEGWLRDVKMLAEIYGWTWQNRALNFGHFSIRVLELSSVDQQANKLFMSFGRVGTASEVSCYHMWRHSWPIP
jgi:hypothetical protein